MVKVDLSQDYYGDLELNPKSGVAEIKKQYKKLALVYHPDRNVGNSNSDNTRFQRIQAAYEVLIDPLERAKYDANRMANIFSCVQNARSGTDNKGNPWSNFGKDYPPPPKAPTTRHQKTPPTSNGARRYEKFSTSRQSAYQATQEGPQARKATYDAWENMRSNQGNDKTGNDQGKFRGAPDLPPRRRTSQSYRKEKRPVSPTQSKTSDSSKEIDPKNKDPSASRLSNNKKGFMPGTPGGDEMQAPRGHYSTQRPRNSPPPIPPRTDNQIKSENPEIISGTNEKLKPEASFERRISTPYATHGGERLNPFEFAPTYISRSMSAREREAKYSFEKNTFDFGIGAESGFKKPSRAHSVSRPPSSRKRHANTIVIDSSDSESTIDVPHSSENINQESDVRKEGHTSSAKTKPDSRSESLRTEPRMPGKYNQEPLNTTSSHHLPKQSTNSDVIPNGANIFSFNINDDTFTSTKPLESKSRISHRTENISTKFSAEDWNGKFSAGFNVNCFNPNSNSRLKSRHDIHSTNKVRDQSPEKSQKNGYKHATTNESKDNSTRKRFSAEEWTETFKPQTFMPQPSTSTSATGLGNSTNNRRKTCSTTRLGTSTTTTSASDCLNSEDNQSKVHHESGASNANIATAEIPEPMDIDTPNATNVNPIIPEFRDKVLHTGPDFQKRRASCSTPSQDEDGIQASTLKVNLSDLMIEDPILNFPLLPSPPILPQGKRPSHSSFREYEKTFQQYMLEWDQFDKNFLLHFVKRKNINENLGENWLEYAGAKYYRTTIKQDQAILKRWAEAKENHEKAVTNWIIFKDFMKSLGKDERPQKNPT